MPHSSLTDAQRTAFHSDGVLVIPQFYDLLSDVIPIQRGVHDIIGQVMDRFGIPDNRPPFSPATFDSGFQELIKSDRGAGSVVYDAVKQLPAFQRLVAHMAHESLFRDLRKGSVPGIAGGGSGIRIDNPGEDRFRAMWHQEYPAQLRSLDGIVFWTPLVPVTEDMGPVVFCLGSHKGGPLPVYTHAEGTDQRSGAYALALKDESRVVASFPQAAPLTNPGDLVIIDFLTLHASGHNRGSRSRWSMQFRFFNFIEPVGKSHSWRGSFAAGVDFRSVHPELCAD